MVFSSLIFIFWFLPAFFLVYFLLPSRARNSWLLFSSLVFYAWGAPTFLPLLALTTVVDYLISRHLSPSHDRSHRRRYLLAISICTNLSILAYCKYANFFVDQLNALFAQFGGPSLAWATVALPIGISFITFEKISYVVDVYTGKTPPAENFLVYCLFIALFPHLIAGPIFRYHDISTQLSQRELSLDNLCYGMWRFSAGLAKKVLIADCLSEVADKIFLVQSNDLPPGYAWLGVLCYSFQIYFDFSGYSDMAIGLGRMMGFRFLENFNRPYRSRNITDFWRRWHISLSNWMREYLYVPLGGNRVAPWRMYANLWLVFLLSGLWHGASWTFVFWGAYHGFFLTLDKMFLLRLTSKLPGILQRSLTFLIVLFGWVLFRTQTIADAGAYIQSLLSVFTEPWWGEALLLANIFDRRAQTMFVIAALLSFWPLAADRQRSYPAISETPSDRPALLLLRGFATITLLFLSTLSLVNSDFHPFIYFRF